MFSKILKSKARRQVLEIFIQEGGQKHYLRELADMLRYSPGSLQRELTSLEQDGLLVSEKIGNMKFFSLNKKSPFLKEIKRILESEPPEPIKIKVKQPKKEVEKPIIRPESPKNEPDQPIHIHIE